MTTYTSGSKPRYDDGGTEFGDMHRELPKNFGLFDIDRMSGRAVIDLELTRANEAFIEYRTLWDSESNEIEWKALIEVKHKDGQATRKAMETKKGTSSWAQLKLAERLGARYFIVIATNGIQPFAFYEFDYAGNSEHVGTLDYNTTDRKKAVTEFWKKISLF